MGVSGSASQRAIGTGVLGGMLTGTGLAIFFVPIFFVVVRGTFKGNERQNKLYRHELQREVSAGATAGDQI
jgi:multidrug efflux pump